MEGNLKWLWYVFLVTLNLIIQTEVFNLADTLIVLAVAVVEQVSITIKENYL